MLSTALQTFCAHCVPSDVHNSNAVLSTIFRVWYLFATVQVLVHVQMTSFYGLALCIGGMIVRCSYFGDVMVTQQLCSSEAQQEQLCMLCSPTSCACLVIASFENIRSWIE
jgi:hypothetical protein